MRGGCERTQIVLGVPDCHRPIGHSIIPSSHIFLFPHPYSVRSQNSLENSIQSQINSIESQILPWLPAHVKILDISANIQASWPLYRTAMVKIHN